MHTNNHNHSSKSQAMMRPFSSFSFLATLLFLSSLLFLSPNPTHAAPKDKENNNNKNQKNNNKKNTQPGAALPSIEDTSENRAYQATRVLQASPLSETLEGLLQEATRVKGPEKAKEMRIALSKSDTTELSKQMHRAYATTFTAEELAFLADYSNSEVGKRVQRKMSTYVGKVAPAMEAFTKHVFGGKLPGQPEGQQQQQQQPPQQVGGIGGGEKGERGNKIIMNSEKSKKEKKEKQAAAAAAKAAKQEKEL